MYEENIEFISKLDALVSVHEKWVIAGVLLLLAGLAAFRLYGVPAKIPEPKEANALWKNYIGGYTSGIVSRKSSIRIEFLTDVFPKEMVGQSAASCIAIEPGISGEYSVSGTREITIVPKSELNRGQHYLVRIKGGRMEQLPPDIGDFEFVFQVIEQALEIDVKGLTVSGADDKVMDRKELF